MINADDMKAALQRWLDFEKVSGPNLESLDDEAMIAKLAATGMTEEAIWFFREFMDQEYDSPGVGLIALTICQEAAAQSKTRRDA